MISAAKAGYRAITPDYRGYGLSQIPSEAQKTTFNDLIDDLLAILDFFGIPKVAFSSYFAVLLLICILKSFLVSNRIFTYLQC